jgi:hypothetical protein
MRELKKHKKYKGIQKHKKYELQNMYNEFKQYRLYEIKTYNFKQIQMFSRTLEIKIQQYLVLPT